MKREQRVQVERLLEQNRLQLARQILAEAARELREQGTTTFRSRGLTSADQAAFD